MELNGGYMAAGSAPSMRCPV